MVSVYIHLFLFPNNQIIFSSLLSVNSKHFILKIHLSICFNNLIVIEKDQVTFQLGRNKILCADWSISLDLFNQLLGSNSISFHLANDMQSFDSIRGWLNLRMWKPRIQRNQVLSIVIGAKELLLDTSRQTFLSD